MSHGGKRRGAGRSPGRLEDLFEVYKAIEKWRDSGKRRRFSVREACQQIADRGGLQWIDLDTGQPVHTITNAADIRNRYLKAVAEIVRPAKSRGGVVIDISGSRRTPKSRPSTTVSYTKYAKFPDNLSTHVRFVWPAIDDKADKIRGTKIQD
jgi:hypothetical protein